MTPPTTTGLTIRRRGPRAAARWTHGAGALLLVVAWSLGLGCSYRPPRFADRAPVTAADDDLPIGLPQQRAYIEQLYYSDVYVRRALVNGLDPQRTPEAQDINSLDEVVRSSWYRGVRDSADPLRGYVRVGPPLAPVRFPKALRQPVLPDARIAVDGRGLRYELQPDLSDRPEMRSSATAIASRLVWALGYHSPEVWVVEAPTGERVSATHWPAGVDLGPTLVGQRRPDDPNDQLPHVDRRTLRALGMVAAWLGMARLEPRMLRDVYVRRGGRGHVEHQLIGLDGALGVSALLDMREEAADPDRGSSNLFFRLATLGLSPKPPVPAEQIRWPSLGQITEVVVPDDYDPSPPFEPIDRVLAADGYWIAKRIAGVSDEVLRQAIDAGSLSSTDARRRLEHVLTTRRDRVAALGFAHTTPCEVVRVALPGPRLVLRDQAIVRGHASGAISRYRAEFLDADGETVAEPATAAARGAVAMLPLPPRLAARVDYLVARITVWRADREAPRPVEVHLARRALSWTVLGVRH